MIEIRKHDRSDLNWWFWLSSDGDRNERAGIQDQAIAIVMGWADPIGDTAKKV